MQTIKEFEFPTKSKLVLEQGKFHFYGLKPTELIVLVYLEYDGYYAFNEGEKKAHHYNTWNSEYFLPSDKDTAIKAFEKRLGSEDCTRNSGIGKSVNDLCEPDHETDKHTPGIGN